MKILKTLKRKVKEFICLRRLKKVKKYDQEKINVVFICQCQHIINKTDFFIKNLANNDRYKVSFYIVKDPMDDGEGENVFESFAKRYGIDFYHYEDTSLKDLKPFYVFYPRPYDVWLPKEIKPFAVTKYAYTAFIPYGYSTMELGDVNLTATFTRSINLIFAEMDYAYDYVLRTRGKYLNKGYQNVYNLGCSSLDGLSVEMKNMHGTESAYKNVKSNGLNVMWAPRWVTDEKLGGSNFFRYIDHIFDLTLNSKDYGFVFRPHPYAFDNYVKNGTMTEQQKEDYLSRISDAENAFYDNQDEYYETFLDCDVLISDVSSIIPEYLITKKPIIFCHNEGKDILNDKMKEMCQVFYCVNSFEEIKDCLENLKNGVDPLKEKREKYVEEFKQSQLGTVDRMIAKLGEFYAYNQKR